MSSEPVYFVHISDTHIGPSHDYELYGRNTYACAERLVQAITSLPVIPDFIIHTGDIVDGPVSEAYRLASTLFAEVPIPLYFVTGNHDDAHGINSNLTLGPTVFRSSNVESLYYSFAFKGFRFVVMDAKGPEEIDPQGLFPEGQIEFLNEEISRDDAPVSVFVHFPPLPLDSYWLDTGMLLLNGEDLHAALLSVRHRVRGVFFGHVHRGIQQFRDGILYSSVGSSFRQFSAWPADQRPHLDDVGPASFNFVTLMDNTTIVKEHFVALPGL
jgi:3',5'-cyclic-AMP phosphodiesterase